MRRILALAAVVTLPALLLGVLSWEATHPEPGSEAGVLECATEGGEGAADARGGTPDQAALRESWVRWKPRRTTKDPRERRLQPRFWDAQAHLPPC